MPTAATVPMAARRWEPCVRTIRIRGLDLTPIINGTATGGLDLLAQVRMTPDNPVVLVDLPLVATANTEGLRVSGVATEGGVPVSTIEWRINEPTMEGLPFEGEVGDVTTLYYGLQVTFANLKKTRLEGKFLVLPGAVGSDSAPYDRPASYSGQRASTVQPWSSADLTIANDEVIELVLDGAAEVGALAAQATEAAARAAAAEGAVAQAAAQVTENNTILTGFNSTALGTYGPPISSGATASTGNARLPGLAFASTVAGPIKEIEVYVRTVGNGTATIFGSVYDGANFDTVITIPVYGITATGQQILRVGVNFAATASAPAGTIFGTCSSTSQATFSYDTQGTATAYARSGLPSGNDVVFTASTNRILLRVTIGTPLKTVQSEFDAITPPLAGYESGAAVIGSTLPFGANSAAGHGVARGPASPTLKDGLLDAVSVQVRTAGAFTLIVAEPNGDGTYTTASLPFTATGTSLQRFSLGGIACKKGTYVLGRTDGGSGSASLGYKTGGTGIYVASGDGTGTAVELTTTANELLVNIEYTERPTIQADLNALQEQLDNFDPDTGVPLATDGSALSVVRGLAALNAEGGANPVRVAFWGDSWTERVWIAQRFRDIAGAGLGLAGHGWISVDSDYSGTSPPLYNLDGVTFAKSPRANSLNNAGAAADGWVTVDYGGAVPGAGYTAHTAAADGFCIFTTRADATVTIGNLKTQTLRIWYKDTTGTWRYRVDGGPWTTVTGGGSNAVTSVAISSLADAVHSFEIDTAGNTGTVVLYGFYATRAAKGVEVSKIGNGGATSADLATISAFGVPYWASILPHVLFLIDGTNDASSGIGKASYKASLQTAMNAIWAASPATVIVLVPSPENSSTAGATALLPYAEGGHDLALANPGKAEFYNARAAMGQRQDALWADGLHLNAGGARSLMRGLIDKLLWGLGL